LCATCSRARVATVSTSLLAGSLACRLEPCRLVVCSGAGGNRVRDAILCFSCESHVCRSPHTQNTRHAYWSFFLRSLRSPDRTSTVYGRNTGPLTEYALGVVQWLYFPHPSTGLCRSALSSVAALPLSPALASILNAESQADQMHLLRSVLCRKRRVALTERRCGHQGAQLTAKPLFGVARKARPTGVRLPVS
jgi:hypothetical protein